MSNTTPIIPANAREVHMIEYIACLDKQIYAAQDILKDRLKKIPNGWRNFRLAQATTEKVIDAIYGTLTPKTLLHLQRLCDHGEVVIRPKPMVPLKDDVHFILSEDLHTLINTSIAAECAMCLKEKPEQKKCKLRKALQDVAPVEALAYDGLCPYSRVALDHDLGDDI